LALVRADQGGLAEAVQMNRAAVSEYRQVQGKERFELGMSLTALGDELTLMNQLIEAEAALREAETIFRKLTGETHPTFATNLCFQAYLFYRKDHPKVYRALSPGRSTSPPTLRDGIDCPGIDSEPNQ
jgi:hypothetical protein